MNKRYQVFVSSTYADLKEERSKVIQTIMELDCIPAGMEIFPAIDEEQFEFIKKIIDDCDYYILIIGGRYGSLSEEGISYTEMEYDYAAAKNIKIIAFIHENPDEISLSKSEKDNDLREKLQSFRGKVKTNRIIKFWNRAEDLPGLVALSLSKTIKTYPAIGWIRANTSVDPELYKELNNIRKENDELKSKDILNPKVSTISLDELAGLEDLILISGTHTFWDNSYAQDQVSNWQKKLTWNEIFALISPYLLTNPNDEKVKETLGKAIYETIPNSLSIGFSDLNDQNFQTIKVQFKALKLIDLKLIDLKTANSKIGINLLWNVTEKGENLMLKLRSIKKNI